MQTKIPPWTFSQLDAFETCPRKYYHLRVAKDVVDPPNEAALWGDRVHKSLESRLLEKTPLPEGMNQWEPIMMKIERLPGEKHTEMKLALDENFQPSDWKQSWTRGIADVAIVSQSQGVVLDYKTGKRKPTDQLLLYAAYLFAYFPKVDVVDTVFVWLKEKKLDKEKVHRDELPSIWKKFLPKYHKLVSAYERDSWVPRPSGLCKGWCPCTGCEFNGKR